MLNIHVPCPDISIIVLRLIGLQHNGTFIRRIFKWRGVTYLYPNVVGDDVNSLTRSTHVMHNSALKEFFSIHV